MNISTKNSLSLSKDFLKKWEKKHGHVYSYFDLFDFFFPVEEYSCKSIKSIWNQFIKSKKKNDKIDFYINIPFCLQKCAYCITGSHKLKNNNELKEYVDYLIKEFSYFKKTFSNVKFTNLYIGGGTPSILNNKLLNKLLSELFSCFNFEEGKERTCELNPISSSLSKLILLKKNGFNRVSFGVQSFNQKVLDINNRGYQTNELIEKAVTDARKAGFKNINIDLMIGIHGDNEKSFIKSFKKAFKFDVSTVSLYPFQPKVSYLRKYFNSDKEKFINYLKKLINSNKKEIIQIAKNNKFHFDKELFNDKDAFVKNGCWKFTRENSEKYIDYYGFEDNNSIFGLGYSSISCIKSIMRYYIEPKQTNNNSFTSKYKGTSQSQSAKMLYYIGKNLTINKYISKKDFKDNFGLSFLNKFKKNIDKFEKFGIIESSAEDKIYFKSNNLNEIFLSLLFFLEKENSKLISYGRNMKKLNKEKINDKKQKDVDYGNVLDGIVINKKKTFIIIKSEKKNKEIKVSINSKTIYIKLSMSLPEKSISQTKIKWSDISIDDEVSLIMDEDKKDYVKEVRKIVVVSNEDE